MSKPNRKKSFFVFVLSFILHFFCVSQSYSQSEKQISNSKQKVIQNNLQKQTSNDMKSYIDINEITMFFANNGMGSYNFEAGSPGFYWPKSGNFTLTAVFEDGLIIGGKVYDEVSVGGSTYRYGLQAGKILPDGKADDPSLDKYRIYKIKKNWEQLPLSHTKSALEKDYNEWPVEDGAPWIDNDKDGIYNPKYDEPALIGDEVNWMVMNDLDASRTNFLFGSLPMGLEVQCTIWGYKIKNTLQDVVFKKYKIINKGKYRFRDVYLGIWSDTDLGYQDDDYAGCDTLLNLGYCYNADNKDEGFYELNPPAVGYKILQSPIVKGNITDSAKFNNTWKHGFKNLGMTAFVSYLIPNYPLHIELRAREFYNFLQGLSWDGTKFINPINNQITKFMVPGDPENETGWYEGGGWPNRLPPGDRRILLSSGPFNFAQMDTQEIAFAIIMARGNNNLNSVSVLKKKAKAVQIFYDNYEVPSVKNFSKPEVTKFGLGQNHPNPFNSSTVMKFAIPLKSKVVIKVYDVLGNEVSVLVNEEKDAGEYQIQFKASSLASGIYFCNFQAREINSTKKLIVLK